MYPLLTPCPVCRMPSESLCRNSDDSVRTHVHPRRLIAHLAYEMILSLAHRVPYSQRWELTRQVLQSPDHSAPTVQRTAQPVGDTETTQHELADVTELLEKVISSLSQAPHGIHAQVLVRHLQKARASSEHYRHLLAHAQREFAQDQDAALASQELEAQLLMRRAHRVQTDLRTIAGSAPSALAPLWRVRYRHNGTFRANRVRPLPAEHRGDQLTRAWGHAPTPEAAQRAVSHLVGAAEHRVTLKSAQSRRGMPLIELDPALFAHPDRVWQMLEKGEPGYQAFLESCEQVREDLAQVEDLGAWVVGRAEKLNATHPQCPPHMMQIAPSLYPNIDHTLTRVEAITWVGVERIVATYPTTWGQLNDHQPWRPVDLAQDIVEATTEGQARALARKLFIFAPMRLTRINAWAGPVYTVGEGGDGRHRAHTLRMVGLGWAAAHITHPVPAPCVDMFGLVADDEKQDRERRVPVERVRERVALINGLRRREIIDAWWDADHEEEWLWCRSIPAPWLLRNAAEATAANRTYEATYPGALARLGIPEQVGCNAQAWTTWLTDGGPDW